MEKSAQPLETASTVDLQKATLGLNLDGGSPKTTTNTTAAATITPVGFSTTAPVGDIPRLLDTPRENDDKSSGWSNCVSANFFKVRSLPRKKKGKAPSAPSFYECVVADRVTTKKRVLRARDVFPLSKYLHQNADDPVVPGAILPEFIILHLQLPLSKPSMIRTVLDGPSEQFICVLKIKRDTCAMLAKDFSKWPNALKLLAAWTKSAASDDKMKGRLKLICHCQNHQAIGLPSLLTGYNGKPVLLTNSTKVFRESSYMEASSNVAKFNFMARQGWSSYGIPKLNIADMRIACLIEGRKDSELPERILACLGSHFLRPIVIPK